MSDERQPSDPSQGAADAPTRFTSGKYFVVGNDLTNEEKADAIVAFVEAAKRDGEAAAERELVYGVINGHLVFLPMARANSLAQAWDAWSTAKTWGEFRAKMPAAFYAEAVGETGETGEEDEDEDRVVHEDSEPFDNSDIETYGGGPDSWPAFAEQEMLDVLPDAVIRLGEVTSTTLDGEMLELPPEREADVLAILEANGWRVNANEVLLTRAMGFSC